MQILEKETQAAWEHRMEHLDCLHLWEAGMGQCWDAKI